MKRKPTKCRHCRRRPAVAMRLCGECFVDAKIRNRYAEAVDAEPEMRVVPLADTAEPTDAEPGSEDKVAVLARRYRMGLPLWVPGDAEKEE